MTQPKLSRWRFALRLASIRLLINILVAAVVAALVFFVWYPQPYPDLMGGLQIFGLIVAVDIICGPVLTSVLANPAKPKRETVTDLLLVGMIQAAALLYGLYTVTAVRPVWVVFENDRFTTVSAAEIDKNRLNEALPEFRQLPWTGVKRIAVRDSKSGDEEQARIEMSMQGIEPRMLPAWWEAENETHRDRIRSKMRPVAELEKRYPGHPALAQAISKSGLPSADLYYLPFTSQENKDWTVLLDKNTDFKAFAPLDAFKK